MKRVIEVSLAAYVGASLVGLYKEARGDLTCHCSGDCWCKRGVGRLFRWSFPIGHSLRTGGSRRA